MAWADFIVNEAGEVFALDLDTIPGMSWDSNFLTAAGLRGPEPAPSSPRSCARP